MGIRSGASSRVSQVFTCAQGAQDVPEQKGRERLSEIVLIHVADGERRHKHRERAGGESHSDWIRETQAAPCEASAREGDPCKREQQRNSASKTKVEILVVSWKKKVRRQSLHKRR